MKTVTVLFLVALITVEMNISCALSSTKKLEKPGACPKTSPGSIGICVEQCSGDETCPGKMKCCSNGCGHVCKIPVFKVSWSCIYLVDDDAEAGMAQEFPVVKQYNILQQWISKS
ncbi:WAP four-disulfide core domain protein 18-like [Arvicanthis niloticus]|uniref:WAP four-disulfide core domain protein 18-like n=1 Tax=Arvicanthis niloticus TaxID=61156 RepID=UPI00148696B6|nr:WAP four-disulfide core domain protein 18-like [Arvicanthis niloticus]